MVTLYLIRHAESMGNVEEYFQGSLDVDISPKGLRQLESLKRRFESVSLDAIYTSPLIRAVKTAEVVNYNKHLQLIKVPQIEEIYAGEFQGKDWSELPVLFPKEYYDWKHNQGEFKSPNGESMKDVYNRMVSAMNDILSKSSQKTIAVVSHGCAIKNYQCYLKGLPLSRMHELGWADNTSVSKVVFSDSLTPTIEYLNDSSHLSTEDSTLKYSQWCKK